MTIFSGMCLLFMERDETEIRNVACFIGKKCYFGNRHQHFAEGVAK